MEQIDILKRSLHRNWELTRHLEKVLEYHKLFGDGVRLHIPEDQCENGCIPELQPKKVVEPDITQKGDNPALSPNKVIPSLVEIADDILGGIDKIDDGSNVRVLLTRRHICDLRAALAAQKRKDEAVGEALKVLRQFAMMVATYDHIGTCWITTYRAYLDNDVADTFKARCLWFRDKATDALAALDEIEKGHDGGQG